MVRTIKNVATASKSGGQRYIVVFRVESLLINELMA
jgi:hypothetical protein